jgi:5-methylcytosine-specific restriction endonuclease McrA
MASRSRNVADRARKLAVAKRQEFEETVDEISKLYREVVPPKTPMWKALVISELYRKQNGLCALCGASLELGNCHVDHKIPVSRGGGNERENLQLTHRKCNQSKGAKVDTRDLHHYIKDEVEKRNL